jgi:hypothetical protein
MFHLGELVFGRPFSGYMYHLLGTVEAVSQSGTIHFLKVIDPPREDLSGIVPVSTSSMLKYVIWYDSLGFRHFFPVNSEISLPLNLWSQLGCKQFLDAFRMYNEGM